MMIAGSAVSESRACVQCFTGRFASWSAASRRRLPPSPRAGRTRPGARHRRRTISSRPPRDGCIPRRPGATPTFRACGRSPYVGSVPLERCAGFGGRDRRRHAVRPEQGVPDRGGVSGAGRRRPPGGSIGTPQAITEGNFGQALQSGVTDPTLSSAADVAHRRPAERRLLPEMTAEGKRLSALMKSSWALPGETPVWDSPLDFDTWDRCITRGMPASMFPFRYNNGVRIIQAPGLRDSRHGDDPRGAHHPVGRVDGRPASRRSSSGWASRAAAGKATTLVIETTNFKPGASATNIGVLGSPRREPLPDERADEDHRAHHAAERRDAALRDHDRGSGRADAPVDGALPAEARPGVRVVGVRVPRRQPHDSPTTSARRGRSARRRTGSEALHENPRRARRHRRRSRPP